MRDLKRLFSVVFLSPGWKIPALNNVIQVSIPLFPHLHATQMLILYFENQFSSAPLSLR